MAETTPKGDERTLAESVGGLQNLQNSCGWVHGDAVVSDMLERCKASECLKVIDELEEHIRSMGIADRFSRTEYLGQRTRALGTPIPDAMRMNTIFGQGGQLNEAGHKRGALLRGLSTIRSEILSVFGTLRALRLDIEATNMNDDGTHAATPPKDSLPAGDLLPSKG